MPESTPVAPTTKELAIRSESELLAIHRTDPHAARWFALAARALKHGHTVTYYAEDGLEAAAPADAQGEYQTVSVYQDRKHQGWHWLYSWTANAGEEDEDQVEDRGYGETWPEAVAACLATMDGLSSPD